MLTLELEVSQANDKVAAITEEMERQAQAAAAQLAASEERRRAAEDEVIEYLQTPFAINATLLCDALSTH